VLAASVAWLIFCMLSCQFWEVITA